tara:strand:- start:6606 stop:7031 length:426 start_codon:yes stop_codon:yes gene_type:complete
MRGFICNDNATTEIATSYGNGVLLHEDSGTDPRSRAMPQSCWLSHVDIQLTSANNATTVSAFLTWDSGKDHPMTGEATGYKLQSGSTSNLKHVTIALDADVTAPTAQTTAGKCYLWVLVDDSTGTPVVASARLHWADNRSK